MRNKVALALLVLAATIVLGACGGTQEDGVLGASGASNARPPPSGKVPRSDPRKSCESQGINATQLYPGSCTEGGVQYVVANFGGVVKLRTLAVTITGVAVAPEYRGTRRAVLPQYDAFLRISLQVQNRDKVPHRFEVGQTMLGIAGDNYLERKDVERTVHTEAIARVNGGQIGPGETLSGDVVFDITEADYQELRQRGRFFIWNFGDRASPQLGRGSQVGQIRLYAIEPSAQQQQAG